MGVLFAAPCFGEEGDQPSADSMVYAVTYCTVFSVGLHHTTQHYTRFQGFIELFGSHSSLLAKGPRWRLLAAIDALNLFQLPAEA